MPEAISADSMSLAGSLGDPKGLRSLNDLVGGVPAVPATPAPPSPDIIDIRRSLVETDLKQDVMSLFNPTHGPRQLPTLLLYNEKGLQLFEDVCTPLDSFPAVNG